MYSLEEFKKLSSKKKENQVYGPSKDDVLYQKYLESKPQKAWRDEAIERLTPKALTPPTQAGPTYLEKLAENREKAKQLSARVPETATAASNIREMIFGKPIEAGTVNPRISAADFSTRYDSMTDREKAAYTYLKNTDAKKADEYLKAIEMDINARNAEKRVADAKKIAEESTAAGLYERFMGNNVVSNGAATAYELWQGLRNQPVDPNHPLLAGQDIVKGQNEAFVGDSKGIERYLREGAMGAFDFGTNIALGGAMGLKGQALQNMVKGSFAAQAFAGSAQDAAEREGTGMQSVMTGTASAALATIIEGIGLERLMEIGRMANARGILKSMAKSIVPEGLEEGVEEAGNILADAVIMGDKNEIVGLYNTARANGATQNDAMMAAIGQAGKQIGESAIIGGISGGLIGGGVAMTNRALGGNVLENDVPDTNVGETEQLNTATPQNPVTGHETAISDELTDSSPATKTQPTEAQTKQARDRDSYLDKYYHENGANILRAEGERLGSLKDAEDIYRSYYTAGVMGLNFDEVEQTAFTPLADKSVATEMYKAGINDKAADMEARLKGQTKLSRQTPGVLLKTEAVTEKQKALANLVAKLGKVEVEIVDTLPSRANGEYQNGRIYVALDAESFSGALFHETVHYIAQANAKGYDRMAQTVMRMAAEVKGMSVDAYVRAYEDMYADAIEKNGYDAIAVREELIADAFQMLAADEARCRSLIAELKQTEPTVLEQIKEFLQKMLETLEGLVKDGRFHAFAEDINKDIENTKKLQKIFAEELREAGKTAETKKQPAEQNVLEKVGVQIDNATQSAAPKMSLRDSEGRELSAGQREYFKDSKAVDENGRLLVMYHGTRKGEFEAFRDWTYLTANKDYAERYTDKDTGKTMYEVYANIQKPFDTRLPEVRAIFEDEFMGVYGGTPLQESGLPDWTDGYDLAEFIEENGYDFDAILLDEGADPDGKGGVIERGISYVIRSSEQAKDVKNLAPTSDKRLKFSVRESGEAELRREHAQFPVAQDVVDEFVAEKQGAKFSIKQDSEGRKLSAEQQNFFKNSKAVDANGNLQVVYHGSKNSGFNVFQYDKNVQTGTDYGEAYYFTSDRRKAEGYSYDVNKDERVAQYKRDRETLKKQFLKTQSKEDADAFLNYRYEGKKLGELMDDEEYMTEGGEVKEVYLNLINPLVVDAGGKYYFEVYQDYFDRARRSGNDGIIVKNVIDNPRGKARPIDVYIAFKQEQIKNTTNTAPTNSKDIRWSVRESGEAELRRENASLMSENKHLQKMVENLKHQFELTDGTTPDQKSVRRVAKAWLKQTESKADLDDFAMKLGKITEYFAKAEDKNDHDHAMAALRVLVRKAMEEAEILNTEMRDNYIDLIDRIKNTTLKVTEAAREELEYYGGYNSFRREHFGSMTLNSQKGASIDSFYNELCSDYPEFFKEEDATNEGERLMRISEVLDTLKPVAENPYGYYIDEYVYDETMGLLDKMADIQMEQTFADKKKAEKTAALKKLKDEFNAERKKMRDEIKAAQEEAKKYLAEADEQWYEAHKARGEERAKYLRLKKRNKENADKRKRSAYRKSAEKTLKELLNWMRKPNEKKHVQEAYLPLIQVLTKIDTGRKDIEIKQADVASIVSKLDKLEKEGYASDLTDAVRNIANNFEDYFEDGMHLEDMTTEQMKALRDFIKGIKQIIVDNNKAKAMEQIERISDLGDGVIDKADKSKNVKATGRGRALADFFGLELLTPNVFFKGITDSVHENLYKGLRTAHEQKAGMVNEAMTFINEESRLKDRAKWEREKVREFTVSNGQKAYLTVPQIMSLYCHMKREQSKVHIVGGEIKQINGKTKVVQAGGIQIEPYDGRWTGLKNRKAAEAAMKQTERILVTEEDVKTITDTLTEQQKKLADAIQKFFSTVAAGWGNATSMLMWGYKNFLEPNYFPIESSEDFMVREYGVNADGRPVKQLKNLGFTHNTVTGANNPIIIRDIFSVFATHIDQMASYAAFVPILSDMQKFMNYKQYEQVGVTEDGKPVWKLKSSVSNALKVFMGLKAEGYINDLMRQINMAAGRDDTSSFPVQMTRRMKIAVVGANLRVMAQQPTSIVRAAAVINPVYLLNPANTAFPADYRIMHKYAPISLLKKWGGADMDTGRTMKQMLTGGNWYDKTVDISMWGAGAMDARTWGRIWKACVQETKANNPKLEGEELYLKAGQRFADVIDETQVVDTPLHRTAIMRKDSALMKMATSFMSEPLKTYNMLFDIGRNLYQNPKDGKAYRKFVATSFTLFLNAVAVSAAAGLVDAMRDDDEDEEFWDKWMKAFKGDYSEVVTKKDFAMAALTSNLGDNMNPAAMIPFVKDAWSIIQGYDVERTDVTWMADMVNWAKNMIKFMEGDSKFTMQGMMKNTAENFSKMLGVPAKSLLRDLEAIENTYINHIVKVDAGERIEGQIDKKARTHRMGSEDNLNYYIDKIVKLHFTGNNSLGAEYANKLVDSGIDSEKVQDRIDSALKARCKAEPAAMEAAEAWLAKDYTTMESKLDELKDMGYSGEVAQSAMTSLYNKMVGEDDEPSAEEIKDPFDGDDVDYKKIYRADLKEAYENGGNTGRIENQLRSLGLKDKDINGVYRDKISDMFDKANAKGNKTEMERLIDEYVKYNGKESTLRNRIK